MRLALLLFLLPALACAHLSDAERRTLEAAQKMITEMRRDLGTANTANIQLQESVVVMKQLSDQTDAALDKVDVQNAEIVRVSKLNEQDAADAKIAKVIAEKDKLWWQVAAVGTWSLIVVAFGVKFLLR